MTIRSNTSKILGWIQWGSIAVAVLVAGFTIFICHQQYMAEVEEVRENAQFKMIMAREQIENYLLNTRTILRFISLNDKVMNMTRDSNDYIKAIYKDTYKQHLLSRDIYHQARF
ncbi:MAG: hypothetical protein FVQ85_02270 [Planctomycetes bacterium]|nr:hypothetical protein [Planctomycetota bacterium]